MSDTNGRVLRPGHRIALDQDVYTVIRLNGTAVTLQDQYGELSAILLGLPADSARVRGARCRAAETGAAGRPALYPRRGRAAAHPLA